MYGVYLLPSNSSICWSGVGWLDPPREAILAPRLHPEQVPHTQHFPKMCLFPYTFTPPGPLLAIPETLFPETAVRSRKTVSGGDSSSRPPTPQPPPTTSPQVPLGLPLAPPRAPRQSQSPPRPCLRPYPRPAYRCPPPFPPPLRSHGPRPTPPPLPQPGPAPLPAAANGRAGGKPGSRRVREGAAAALLPPRLCRRSPQPGWPRLSPGNRRSLSR